MGFLEKKDAGVLVDLRALVCIGRYDNNDSSSAFLSIPWIDLPSSA